MGKTKIHTQYKDSDGQRVPSTTTILSLIAKPALIHWAWKLGCEGEDYRKVRDKAGNIGTIAHYLAECHLKDEEPNLDDYAPADVDIAENSFIGFLDFMKEKQLKPILTEEQLVSDKYKYGGTIDCYGRIDGRKALVDLKTSKRIYPNMRVQVAAYKHLLEEHDHKVDDVYILRIDKKDGSFHQHKLKELKDEWEFFKHLLRAYPLKKKVWKR